MLKGKKILIGVTASIAAYKTAVLIRLLIKEGAQVKVMMTPDAHHFITALTLSTLSKNPVLTEYFNKHDGTWNNHVELALWADAMVIAPASANTIAKMANGICDNLLLAVYLSAKCPVYVAPAMDLDMWKHKATQRNIKLLTEAGNQIIQVEKGELASGLVGEGRMAEPENIVAFLKKKLGESVPVFGKGENYLNNQKFKSKKVVVTAGPTVEAIDPVRFISNHSSGKMGIAIADEFAKLGADVILIKGPTNLSSANENVKEIPVTTAESMYQECLKHFKTADILVMAAAVADYTPKNYSDKKIKKNGEVMNIELIKTKDILRMLGSIKRKNQLLVGFALETNDELNNAKKKLKEKNADLIILNSLNDEGAGFKTDTNRITVINKTGTITKFGLKPKQQVAQDIVMHIEKLIHD